LSGMTRGCPLPGLVRVGKDAAPRQGRWGAVAAAVEEATKASNGISQQNAGTQHVRQHPEVNALDSCEQPGCQNPPEQRPMKRQSALLQPQRREWVAGIVPPVQENVHQPRDDDTNDQAIGGKIQAGFRGEPLPLALLDAPPHGDGEAGYNH